MSDRCERPRGSRRGVRPAASRAALVVLVAVGAAACGSTSKPTRGSSSTTTPVRFAPNAVIVQVANAGGFVGPIGRVRQIASVTVLGDGSVITPAVVAAIYPGSAIVPLNEGQISTAQIGKLLADAGHLGLLAGPLDFGRPGVSDMGTTTVRIGDGTRIVVVQSAYALDFTTADGNLTGPQRAARSALQTFIKEVEALPRGRRTFTPSAVAVFTLEGSGAPAAPPPLVWPIATRPAPTSSGESGCIIVKGPEVTTLLEALTHATEITRWKVGAQTLTLGFRPLITSDAACTL
jgi:hypothetical protein